jgi:hypothetical protein
MGAPRFARKRAPRRHVFPAAEHEVGVSERGPIVVATPQPSKDPAPGGTRIDLGRIVV